MMSQLSYPPLISLPIFLPIIFLQLSLLSPVTPFTLDLVTSYGFKDHGEEGIFGKDCSSLSDLPLQDPVSCKGGFHKHAHFIKTHKALNPTTHTGGTLALNLGNSCFGGFLFNLDQGLSCAEAIAEADYDYYALQSQDLFSCPGGYQGSMDCKNMESIVKAFSDGGTIVTSANLDVSSAVNGEWAGDPLSPGEAKNPNMPRV